MARVAINGFGRMGRLALRAGWDHPDLDWVQLNEVAGDAAMSAHLLEFDSIQGRWSDHRVEADEDGSRVRIDESELAFSQQPEPGAVEYPGKPVDIVLECSGQFRSPERLQPFFDNGVRKRG